MKPAKLRLGEPAPWFECRSPVNPRFHFDTVAGRYIVLCFFGSAGNETARKTLDAFFSCQAKFDEMGCCFFGVSVDPQDEATARLQERLPGLHFFWDFDRRVSRSYGVSSGPSGSDFLPQTFVLDERLRVVSIIPFSRIAEHHVDAVMNDLAMLPRLQAVSVADVPAPILVVPRILEAELCRTLIQYYEKHGGEESGFMREVDGKTVAVHHYGHKRRRDQEILDERLRNACMYRIHGRLVPEIRKAFQFHATRIERYVVACYNGSTGGHFRAHRDNTTRGTAHRRFAVSLNLNTGEYEGGRLWFPEFGRQQYVAPTGGAIVFSCSLLHEATPVTSGSRYVFLPFLYDEEGARIRQQNRGYLATDAAPDPTSANSEAGASGGSDET